MGESLVLGFVGFQLRDKVDEVLWFSEELKLFSIDQVAEFIFDLDNKLDNIEGIKTVFSEFAIEGNASFLGGQEIVFDEGQNVLFNLIVGGKNKSVLRGFLVFFPKGNLVGSLIFSWNEISVGIKTEMSLETSGLNSGETSVFTINATAEANMVSWNDHLG